MVETPPRDETNGLQKDVNSQETQYARHLREILGGVAWLVGPEPCDHLRTQGLQVLERVLGLSISEEA